MTNLTHHRAFSYLLALLSLSGICTDEWCGGPIVPSRTISQPFRTNSTAFSTPALLVLALTDIVSAIGPCSCCSGPFAFTKVSYTFWLILNAPPSWSLCWEQDIIFVYLDANFDHRRRHLICSPAFLYIHLFRRLAWQARRHYTAPAFSLLGCHRQTADEAFQDTKGDWLSRLSTNIKHCQELKWIFLPNSREAWIWSWQSFHWSLEHHFVIRILIGGILRCHFNLICFAEKILIWFLPLDNSLFQPYDCGAESKKGLSIIHLCSQNLKSHSRMSRSAINAK